MDCYVFFWKAEKWRQNEGGHKSSYDEIKYTSETTEHIPVKFDTGCLQVSLFKIFFIQSKNYIFFNSRKKLNVMWNTASAGTQISAWSRLLIKNKGNKGLYRSWCLQAVQICNRW